MDKEKWEEIGIIAFLLWIFSMFMVLLMIVVFFINDITGKDNTNHVVGGLLFIFIIYKVQEAIREWLWERSLEKISTGSYISPSYKSWEAKKRTEDLDREERLKKEFEIRMVLKKEEEKELQQRRKIARYKQDIKNALNTYDKFIFERDRLTKEQIAVLQEDGYELANEYCVFRKRVVSTYIKPILHHSKTHVFLVWSVKKFLKKYQGVSKIIEHETRDADLTFKYGGKTYALETQYSLANSYPSS